jgi:hypothetical protein
LEDEAMTELEILREQKQILINILNAGQTRNKRCPWCGAEWWKEPGCPPTCPLEEARVNIQGLERKGGQQ